MDENKLAVTHPQTTYLGLSFADIKNVAQALALSGIFDDAKDANVAFAKVLAGQELGLTPFQSLQEISFIKGKPSVSANVKAAKIKASGKYDYRVRTWTTSGCEIEFFQDGKSVGKINYTEEDARRAGVYDRNPVYKSNPKAMYFAGAIRQGQRAYCPDTMGGIPTYDHEELVEAEVVEPGSQTLPESPQTVAVTETRSTGTDKGEPETEISPEDIEATIDDAFTPNPMTDAQRRKLYAMLNSKGIKGDAQKTIILAFAKSELGLEIESTTELSKEDAMSLIDVLEKQDSETLQLFFGGEL